MTTQSPSLVDRPWWDCVDIVDFVEQTTYAIWNARQPELVMQCYTPETTIWADGGDTTGDAAVTQSTRQRLAEFPDYRGVIADTIWTGDAELGFRTSMRWTSRGSRPTAAGGSVRETSSCIANCVVLGGSYVEEWGAGDTLHYLRQLGDDVTEALSRVRASAVPVGAAGAARTRSLRVGVPAIPDDVIGPGLLVAELVDEMMNRRNLDAADRVYVAGAPYTFGCSRWDVGPEGARRETQRWLDLLPDAHLSIEELYWNGDQSTARVALRTRVSGTSTTEAGTERPVGLTVIHHVHVRGHKIVAQWVEYDELALLAQAGKLPQ